MERAGKRKEERELEREEEGIRRKRIGSNKKEKRTYVNSTLIFLGADFPSLNSE